MALGMLALLTGMWAGMLRLGWIWPAPRPTFASTHGPLMISGFLGTLIGVERAVALGRSWAFAAPALTALGTVALIAGAPDAIGPLLMSAGSLAVVIVFTVVVRAEPALHSVTMGVGALAWLAGNGLWLTGHEVPEVVSWWMGFLVLTIAGERLELSRFLPSAGSSRGRFAGAVVLFLAGLSAGGVAVNLGARLTGVALVALTAWLLRHDIARRTVRQTGLTRFTAVCLLSGYAWLGLSGLLALRFGAVVAGPQYDAVLHGVFVGFVFAMIFGHAPIIFPAVLGVPVPFRRAFYAHLVVLHLSLLLRLFGDLTLLTAPRQWGGLLNAAAVVLFLVNTLRSIVLGRVTVLPVPRPSEGGIR